MFGIHPDTINILNSIFKSYHVIDEVIIYGSRAKGNYREGSDIDITLKGKVSTDDLSKIYSEIDDSLTPYLFDISVYNKLNSESLKDHIDRVGKILYKK